MAHVAGFLSNLGEKNPVRIRVGTLKNRVVVTQLIAQYQAYGSGHSVGLQPGLHQAVSVDPRAHPRGEHKHAADLAMEIHHVRWWRMPDCSSWASNCR